MNPEPEIRRLLDLMPASGRMFAKLVSKPQQSKVIDAPFPVPWNRDARLIYINFDLWRRLPKPQRDLLLLRTVSWLTGIQWLKPDLYQGIVAAGAIATVVEIVQADAIGVLVAGGTIALAANRIWRRNRSLQTHLDADEAAIAIAQRRGYDAVEAAGHLLESIDAVADLEARPSLNFIELIRAQNLRSLANRSPIGVPTSVRQE